MGKKRSEHSLIEVPDLPPGWKAYEHKKRKLTFYRNDEAGLSQWEKPGTEKKVISEKPAGSAERSSSVEATPKRKSKKKRKTDDPSASTSEEPDVKPPRADKSFESNESIEFRAFAIFDTCVLLKKPLLLKRCIAEKIAVVIPLMVVKEIDGLKKQVDGTKYKAIEANTMLEEMSRDQKGPYLIFETSVESSMVLPYFNAENKPDERILKCALRVKNDVTSRGLVDQDDVLFVTIDRNLLIRGRTEGLNCFDIEDIENLLEKKSDSPKKKKRKPCESKSSSPVVKLEPCESSDNEPMITRKSAARRAAAVRDLAVIPMPKAGVSDAALELAAICMPMTAPERKPPPVAPLPPYQNPAVTCQPSASMQLRSPTFICKKESVCVDVEMFDCSALENDDDSVHFSSPMEVDVMASPRREEATSTSLQGIHSQAAKVWQKPSPVATIWQKPPTVDTTFHGRHFQGHTLASTLKAHQKKLEERENPYEGRRRPAPVQHTTQLSYQARSMPERFDKAPLTSAQTSEFVKSDELDEKTNFTEMLGDLISEKRKIIANRPNNHWQKLEAQRFLEELKARIRECIIGKAIHTLRELVNFVRRLYVKEFRHGIFSEHTEIDVKDLFTKLWSGQQADMWDMLNDFVGGQPPTTEVSFSFKC